MIPNAWRLGALAAATGLLTGCLGSLGGPKTDVQIFSPATAVTVDESWPAVDWRLTVGPPGANQLLDSPRIAVRPSPDRLQTYKGARWVDSGPEVLQTAIVQAFEDSGKIPGVSRFGGGNRGDFALLTELRAFETVYGADGPQVVIELQARLLQFRPGEIAASRRFRVAVPTAPDVDSVVAAFGRAMSQMSGELVGWTLAEGERAVKAREEGSAGTSG